MSQGTEESHNSPDLECKLTTATARSCLTGIQQVIPISNACGYDLLVSSHHMDEQGRTAAHAVAEGRCEPERSLWIV